MMQPSQRGASAVPQVSLEALAAHVRRLGGRIGERNVFRPQALAAAADFIEETWTAQGYRVAHQAYETAGVRCANLEVMRVGHSRPDEILLIGAHYDSVMGSPGANDNGSGVAALLELSRLFAGVTPAVSVRFVAFVNEEPPFFTTRDQGSMVYAEAARARADDIRLMVALETIGCYSDRPGSQRYPAPFGLFYPEAGNFLGFVADFRARRLMRATARIFRANSDFPLEHVATFRFIPGIGWSDHEAFWRHGYRAFMVTDTAPYRYPHYHAPSDTPDKLAYPEFGRATEGLWRTFRTVATEGVAGW